jgi:hypothetical protein
MQALGRVREQIAVLMNGTALHRHVIPNGGDRFLQSGGAVDERSDRVNPFIRGWGNYYCRSHVGKRFHQLDGWIIRRLWSHRTRRWRNANFKLFPLVTWLLPAATNCSCSHCDSGQASDSRNFETLLGSNIKDMPAFFPKTLYKAPARIEQAVGKLKRFKRIVLRCEKTVQNYRSFVALALGFILIKSVHRA